MLDPSKVWQERVPAALRDRAPKLVREAEGEAWVYDARRFNTFGLSATAGKSRKDFSADPVSYTGSRVQRDRLGRYLHRPASLLGGVPSEYCTHHEPGPACVVVVQEAASDLPGGVQAGHDPSRRVEDPSSLIVGEPAVRVGYAGGYSYAVYGGLSTG